MSGGETNISVINRFIRLVLQGQQYGGDEEAENPQDVGLTEDRELKIHSPLIIFDGTRNRVALGDASRILRTRPYEPLFPVEPVVLTTTLQDCYTATGVRAEVWCEVSNSGLQDGATVRVAKQTSTDTYDWYPSDTPVLHGVPIRTGFMVLEAGDKIRASCSPHNACTIFVHVHRYNETGDTP